MKYRFCIALMLSSLCFARPQTITSIADLKDIIARHPRVIIEFGAPWCSACTMIESAWHELATDPEFKDTTFVSVNVDQQLESAQAYNAMDLPSIVIFSNGKELWRDHGAGSASHFKKSISARLRKVFNMPGTQEAPSALGFSPESILGKIIGFFNWFWHTLSAGVAIIIAKIKDLFGLRSSL